jgi:formamidopyrimidine-DNA glycosylase
MSAGRLQLYDKRATLRDRTSRLLLRLPEERELRLREFGTKQAAWVKVLRGPDLEADDAVATLGPEAWPAPPEDLRALLGAGGARPLHSVLRDQRVIAGIGRSWVDEILWTARLSPFAAAKDLDDEQAAALRTAMIDVLGGALEHYEEVVHLPIPTSSRCRCRSTARPASRARGCARRSRRSTTRTTSCVTARPTRPGGKVLKDRRLSRC